MILVVALFVLGLILVVKGADWFVEAAVSIARKTGWSEVLIGATLVSLATTLPEMAVSAYSSIQGISDIAFGNALGSIIFNTGVVLGLSSILRPSKIQDANLGSKAGLMLLAGLALALASLGGRVSRLEGLGLLALLGVYLWALLRTKQEPVEVIVGDTSTWTSLILRFLGGAVTVIIGSRLLVNSATAIAEALGVPPIIIALTIVAAGTSMPELVTTIVALRKGYQSLSVGNVIGANFLNVTAVLGLSSLINPIQISAQSLRTDLPVMLLMMGLILVITRDRVIRRGEGVAPLAIYGIYAITLAVRGLM